MLVAGKQIVELPENEAGQVNDIFFSPDDKYVAIGSYHKVTVWDTATWQRKAHLSHAGGISDLKFSPNGGHLAWELKKELGCKIYAYCLMTNHVHLMSLGNRSDERAKEYGR